MTYLPESRKKPYGVEYVFRSLIANFVSAMQVGEQVLIVPRNKSFFPAKNRYRPDKATYGSTIKALEAMVSSGLITQDLGSGKHKITCNYHGAYKCVREATRVRPTDDLTRRLTPLLTVPIHSLTRWRDDTEVIHLRTKTQDRSKGSSSQQMLYCDTPMTKTFRGEVRRINRHLKNHSSHYDGKLRVNLMHDHVARIFNNGDWNQGGRLYDYWPMNLPKGERHYLSIDGEPLADLDFGSCFVALLHVYDGTEFDPDAPDPFKIEGYEELRDAIKQCAYSILNASRRIKNYPEDVAQEDGSRPPLRWREMEELIFVHIPLFQQYAYTAVGLTLMRKESDILVAVLLDLIERGIGFIPMHDGIMVPESKKQITRDLMLRHYRVITGQGIRIREKAIRKPSNHEVGLSYS
ncbi:hypothetical protein JH26_06225 [Microvirga sp. BSC39]|jgi:hypothetical protein|nr:hypothetical protein JH26_06225 [Microvirga sp. BSC39]